MKVRFRNSLKAVNRRELNRQNRATMIFGASGIVFLTMALIVMLQTWQAIFFGILLALILQPLFHKLHVLSRRRKLSAFGICLASLLVLIGPVISLVGALTQQATKLLKEAPRIIGDVFERLNLLSEHSHLFPKVYLSVDQLTEYLTDKADLILQTLSAFTLSQAMVFTDFLGELAIAFLVAYFALVDGGKLKVVLVKKFHLSGETLGVFISDVRSASRAIILGTFAAAFVQAVLMSLAFWVAGLPGYLLAGSVTFVFSFVPLLGSWPITFVGIALGFSMSSPSAVVIVLVFGIMAGVADNVVRVIVSSDENAVHPLFIFLSIFGGLQLMGPIGVIFGPILVTVVYQLGDRIAYFVSAVSEVRRRFFISQLAAKETREPDRVRV